MATALTKFPVISAAGVCVLAILCQACGPSSSTVPTQESARIEGSAAVESHAVSTLDELSERDADIIRYLLREDDKSRHPQEGRSPRRYFLTTTPMEQWGEHGDWEPLPPSFAQTLPSLKAKYRPANEAFLENGCVFEKGSRKEAWMKWITVKRWITDTEVEVEEGVWRCPLGGGASTTTYEKIDGEWHIKSFGPSWVS